jgi:trehalose-6-phosphatase
METGYFANFGDIYRSSTRFTNSGKGLFPQLALHKSDIMQSSFLAKELTDHLINITANIDIQILHGRKVIEISSSGINKGDLARHWLKSNNYDFILAIGAGWSDELLFRHCLKMHTLLRSG